MAATLRLWLPNYERWEARSKRKIALPPELRAKLLRISPATIDRLLRAEKRKLTLRGRSHTKRPTGTLMLQIPIRTFSEWEDVGSGTLGIDLVGHDGGNAAGEFAYTLLATDRRTQWTELRAVPNKAQKWVFQQLLVVRHLLPFELLAVHSDNGSEFINAHLLSYCRQHQIDFTRSRAYRKNDNNFTEQKNFDVVRKHVGYARYDTPEAVELLNELYDRLRLMVNFVRPCAKLIEKTRHGARVRRRYDRPQTPYQRVLACADLSEATKQRLREQFAAIDPIAAERPDRTSATPTAALGGGARHPAGAGQLMFWILASGAVQFRCLQRAIVTVEPGRLRIREFLCVPPVPSPSARPSPASRGGSRVAPRTGRTTPPLCRVPPSGERTVQWRGRTVAI